MSRLLKIIFFVLILIGVSVIIFGSSFNTMKKDDYSIKTTGYISDIVTHHNYKEDDYDVYVTYLIDGEEYVSLLDYYNSEFYLGEEIEITVDENNYNNISSVEGNKIANDLVNKVEMINYWTGIPLFLIGFIGLFVIYKKEFRIKRLKKKGYPVVATFIKTEVNNNIVVNGQCPYHVICKWINPEDNKEYVFKSERIWFDPNQIITDNNINTFNVLINRKNPKKYLVDTSILEKNKKH